MVCKVVKGIAEADFTRESTWSIRDWTTVPIIVVATPERRQDAMIDIGMLDIGLHLYLGAHKPLYIIFSNFLAYKISLCLYNHIIHVLPCRWQILTLVLFLFDGSSHLHQNNHQNKESYNNQQFCTHLISW